VSLEHLPDIARRKAILEEKTNLMVSEKFTAFTQPYLNFREKYPLVEFPD
jgi:hypothetical protein